MSEKETNDYSLIIDITESVKEYFEQGNTVLQKKENLQNENAYFYITEREKVISKDEIIMGFAVGGMAVAFTKNKFCISTNVGMFDGKYRVFKISDFINLKLFMNKENKTIDLMSPPQAKSPTPKNPTFTPTKQVSSHKRDVFFLALAENTLHC